MTRHWLVPVALVVALLAATPAAAAPINLGAGASPSVAVDEVGTAYVTWDGANTLGFCRLARNAKSCDVRLDLPFADNTFFQGRPTILRRSDGVFLIVAYVPVSLSDTRTVVFVSGDGGANWSGPAELASNVSGFDTAILAADQQSVLTLWDTVLHLQFQSAPLTAGETRTLELSDSASYSDIAALPDGRVLVAWSTVAPGIRWRLFGGGDPYDINAWATQGTVRAAGEKVPRLAAGPRGVFMLEKLANGRQGDAVARRPFALRSFDTKRLRWRATRTAGGDRYVFGQPSLTQDGGGRLHIIATHDGGLSGYGCVVYTRTGAKSSQWFGRTTVLYKTRSKARRPDGVASAAAPDGRGFAAWSDRGGQLWATPLRQARGTARLIRSDDKPHCVAR